MANRIDTALETMQTTGSDAVANAVLVDPGRAQLRHGYDTVLASRNLGDGEICAGALVAHIATKSPGSADSPPAALEMSARCGRWALLGGQGRGEVGARFHPGA